MPRGDHLREVTSDEILAQFEIRRSDLGRGLFTAAEIAHNLPVSDDAIRQRLHKLNGDEVEKIEMGGVAFWKLQGEVVFQDGGIYQRAALWLEVHPGWAGAIEMLLISLMPFTLTLFATAFALMGVIGYRVPVYFFTVYLLISTVGAMVGYYIGRRYGDPIAAAFDRGPQRYGT